MEGERRVAEAIVEVSDDSDELEDGRCMVCDGETVRGGGGGGSEKCREKEMILREHGDMGQIEGEVTSEGRGGPDPGIHLPGRSTYRH